MRKLTLHLFPQEAQRNFLASNYSSFIALLVRSVGLTTF